MSAVISAMYAVQIESLEDFQQKITSILQDLEVNNASMTAVDAVGAALGNADNAASFGSFPEGKSFASAYAQTKQDLVNSFNEVTQLVNTMISVVGASAGKYKETEAQIQAKFNAILQQYGDTSTLPQSASTTTTATPVTTYAALSSTTAATTQTVYTPQTTTPTPTDVGSGNDSSSVM